MPTRSRAAARNAQHEEEKEAPEQYPESTTRLKFNEPLSWRAGKPIALADLLRRLEALATELRELEQEEDDHDTFSGVAKELAAQGLLSHKDKGVRAWVACCLVNILRLCAPDAPFTAQQLKEIFSLFINAIIPALSDPSNAYNEQHISVIQSLAEVKSIVLLTDLPSAETLIVSLFSTFFDILSGSAKSSSGTQIGKHVEHFMTEILVILVDEATSLPADVIDTIVAQFLRADPSSLSSGNLKRKKDGLVDEKQSTLELKELPPAYNMAKTICNSCPEKMARYVSQYFNDVIIDASSSSAPAQKSHRRSTISKDDWESDDAAGGPSDEEMKELVKAHKLLRELWRASPAVLQNVIPQLETELSAENVELRVLATETLGDIISGVGAAGAPKPPTFDVAAYPPITLSAFPDSISSFNILTNPASPQSFPQSHPTAFNSFVSRKIDKSPVIRAAWTTAVGRILTTSAGGVGLNQQEEKDLVSALSEKLADSDERVRIAAIKSVSTFGFRDAVIKLGSLGGANTEGSIFSSLADRVKDRKPLVRQEAIRTLARLWGIASGEIAKANENVTPIFGLIPSRILDAFYVNDHGTNIMIDAAMHELLLPLTYPPSKSKLKADGTSQRQENGHSANGDSSGPYDTDMIRVERLLLFVKGLDERAKTVFYTMQARQAQWAQVFEVFLKRCSEYNGGVAEPSSSKDMAVVKQSMGKLIDWFANNLPEPFRASEDLWKFARANDRRSYQLLRFMMNPDSDYKTVTNALREVRKRFNDSSMALSASALESMLPVFYRIGLFNYNRSHVPAIVEISKTDKNGLGATAQEFLKEISTKTPEVFKSHVKELCRSLEDETPTAKRPNQPQAVDTLRACAGFASKFPSELPQDRKFKQCLKSFAQYGSPPTAAKYAVTILMAATEKSRSASDLVEKSLKNFKYGGEHALSKLATLSQLCLLAPSDTEDESDSILDLVLKEILGKVRTSSESEDDWITDSSLDEEISAKMLGLKVLVNRLRARCDNQEAESIAIPVYKLLQALILNDGELSKKKDTPVSHKARLRLLAAQLFLRLSTYKSYDPLLSPSSFNHLACVAQDRNSHVREAFLHKLKKYLGQGRLPARFFTIPFLLDSESIESLRSSTVTWIRSKALTFSTQNNSTMEVTFARLLSLLAHHPDFSTESTTLIGLASNILFYLVPVARAENLALIYHVAQRVKQVRDAIVPDKSKNLYVLSDLAQALIRRWEDIHGWTMDTYAGKLRMPSSLFASLPNHDVAQEIAMKTYLPSDIDDELDRIVRAAARPKSRKRKSEIFGDEAARKKSRSSIGGGSKSKSLAIRKAPKSKDPKTPKKKRDDPLPSSERRKSGRVSGKGVSYAESIEESGEEGEDDVMEDASEEEEEVEEQEDSGEEAEEQQAEEATIAKTTSKSKTPGSARTNGRSTRRTRARGGGSDEE